MTPTRRWHRPARRVGLLGLVAAASWFATSTPVAATEDGGTRSAFAYGAGNRALSLGGAFTAIADDASALIWNPGGLGFVPRVQLQAEHSALQDLGGDEEYAALVWPSWQWGTAALSFRRLGVGGIEERDDRNRLLDDDLGWSQTEFQLGYGRGFGGVGLGGTVKLRRQSLGSFSAGGIGSDLGVLVRPAELLGATGAWTRAVTVGLSLQNLVTPSFRLDQDAVTDPLTARAGVALGGDFGGRRRIVAAIDLERSAHIDPRLHAGLELSLVPSVALRAGWRPEAPTAGAGIQWNGLVLDYAIEDGELGLLHRAGLTWSFGPTTEESRLATRQAQEEALQDRLAEAFDRRQEERAQQLQAEVEEAYRRGLYDDALDRIDLLQALSPEAPAAQEWEGRCWRQKGLDLERSGDLADAMVAFARALAATPADSAALQGADRCRRESDRRSQRSDELRRRFAGALDAFGAGDFLEARAELQAILTGDPNDAEAAAMLERTERAIDGRVAELLDQARRFLQGGLLEEAGTTLSRVRGLAPKAHGLREAENALDQRRRQQAEEGSLATLPPGRPTTPSQAPASASPAPSRTAPSPQQRKELDELYKRGLEAVQAERGTEALRYLELVYSIDPGYLQIRDHLKREYLMLGMDSFAEGRLEEATDLWKKALAVDPTDEKTQGYLARAEQQLTRSREILGRGR